MPKLIIDGVEIEVEDGTSVMQACEAAGAEIPRFCYHERLSVAGNCRMCLIEVKGAPKPMASCATGVNDLRPGPNGELPQIITKSETVKKAREGVMEFLLINHPLDCPICDQGGECDLQDQAMGYGADNSRYVETKRAVEEKYLGPLVKTIMTRCIHCTRCIRFATEVAGVEELGAIGRGEDMEITTYLEAAMTSELSGNVIDLCPVGALTSKPYAFSARPWELKNTATIDVMDAMGAAISVDVRGREVMRITPLVNDDINEEWISDKSRFIWDGLKTQRLDRPYIRENGALREASWQECFDVIAAKVKTSKPERMAALVGDLPGVEEIFALKELMTSLKIPHLDCRPPGSMLGAKGGRDAYVFNSTIAGIEQADTVLLVNTNPRHEAAVLNARLRKMARAGVKFGLIGERVDLGFDYDYLGAGPDTLKEIAQGKNKFAKTLKAAKAPAMILGEAIFARTDAQDILKLALGLADQTGMFAKTAPGGNGFNVLLQTAARAGALDLGFVPARGGLDTAGILNAAGQNKIDLLYLLGADEIDTDSLGHAFVIYQGSHGDRGAHKADVILPGAAYVEKSALYVNTEGRVQQANRAGFPPGDAREDWAILRALSEVLGKTLKFDNKAQLLEALTQAHEHMGAIDKITHSDVKAMTALADIEVKPDKEIFKNAIDDFYLTNPIARASKTMAECSALAKGDTKKGTGTDG